MLKHFFIYMKRDVIKKQQHHEAQGLTFFFLFGLLLLSLLHTALQVFHDVQQLLRGLWEEKYYYAALIQLI